MFDLRFKFSGKDTVITEEFGIHPNLDNNAFILGTLFLSRCQSFHYYGEDGYFVLKL